MVLRLNVKEVTKSNGEYKLYLFSLEVVIPFGKLERLNDDLMMEHSKHLLEEHGSRSPGSPKPHSRDKTSQRLLGVLFLCNIPLWEPIFVLHVTRLLNFGIGIGKMTMLHTDTSRNSSQSFSSPRPYKLF